MLSSKTGNTYKIERRLNRGGFGCIFQALELNALFKTSNIVAVKFVLVSSSNQQLLLDQEIRIFKRLSTLKRFPMFITHIANDPEAVNEPSKHAIIHQLLGPSLYELCPGPRNSEAWKELFGKRKIIKKTLMCLRDIHNQRILHCDIKLQNFCTGLFKESQTKVFLIDFGLALDLSSKQAEYELDSRSWRGTLAFMSPRIQKGHRFSFVDDLVSLFYMLVFAFGTLPWARETDPAAVLLMKEKHGFQQLASTLNDRRLTKLAYFIEEIIKNNKQANQPIDYNELFASVFC